MGADSNSSIAWHRVQLRKNRAALKTLETSRFTIGEIAGSRMSRQMRHLVADLQRKIAESERCIAAYERTIRRPVATDVQSLSGMASWSSWNAGNSRR